MKNLSKSAFIYLAFCLLSACGGGGADNTPPIPERQAAVIPPVNAAPVGNAGADQHVSVGATVTVDGGASHDANGDALTYKWSITNRPSTSRAAFIAATNVRPSFTADVAGIYVASLIVNDSKIDSRPASVTITAAAAKPAVLNTAPTANAGPNQTVPVGTTVTLDGAASSDPNGDALTYRWELVSKPSGSSTAITPTSAVKPQLSLDVAGNYSIALIVNDGKTDGFPAIVLITAVAPISQANAAPTANAGVDQTVSVGNTVYLDGKSSADPNRDPLAYSWSIASKPVGSNAQIEATAVVNPKFVADVSGIYEVRLAVSDGKLSAEPDTIHVVAMSPDAIVIADSGIYRCGTLSKSAALLLYSQGHIYLDRDHDGRPCEANDISNEIASPYVAPTSPSNGRCYVRGYYRKNGTYVEGYYRSCGS